MDNDKKKRGFAALTAERRREIASAGGIARKRLFDQARQGRLTRVGDAVRRLGA